MTDLQKTEFELLRLFTDVCTKLDLTYYLVCGTALGAVKYNGFIPWDDDVDVALPRRDYEIFCKEAQKLLPKHCFVQTYRSDRFFPAFYCKIRDSRTTYIEKGTSHLKMNHGVYIDVFPLDGYPSDPKDAKRLEVKKKLLKLQLVSAFSGGDGQKLTTRVFLAAERILGFHKRSAKIAAKIERLISSYPTENSALWCNHGNWQGKREYAPASQYGSGTWATFEGLKVRIPDLYDEYLTQKYGDWRADLPESEQIGHHYYEVLDLDNPFEDYLSK